MGFVRYFTVRKYIQIDNVVKKKKKLPLKVLNNFRVGPKILQLTDTYLGKGCE